MSGEQQTLLSVPAVPIPQQSAFDIITDLVEDPKDNGDYRLNISGNDLRRLWNAIESECQELKRLRSVVS